MYKYLVTFKDSYGTSSRILISEVDLSDNAIKHYYSTFCKTMFCMVYSIEQVTARRKIVNELIEEGRTDTFIS